MGSDFVDAAWAARYERFEFEFPERTLAGKVILAPGGSGGLGAATVALLAQEGAQVVVGFHRDSARAERLTAALNAPGPGRVHCVQGDLRQSEARNRLVETAARMTGEIYGLVSFLGDPARVDFARLDENTLQESLAINYVTPLLLARQWGGLRVNVVAPGVTQAGMALASVQSGKYDAYVRDQIIPRFGRPEDVARVVRLLLEPDNYLTGQVIIVDGGLTLRRGLR